MEEPELATGAHHGMVLSGFSPLSSTARRLSGFVCWGEAARFRGFSWAAQVPEAANGCLCVESPWNGCVRQDTMDSLVT